MENNRNFLIVKTQLFYEFAMKTRKTGAWIFKNHSKQEKKHAEKLSPIIDDNFFIISFLTEDQPKSIQGGTRKNSESLNS